MKNLSIPLLCMIMLSCSSAEKSSDAGFSKFHLRDFKQATLENGLKVLYVEDKRLPYVNISVLVNSGYASDPSGKSGLTSLAIGLLDKGTSKRNASKVAGDLEQLGMNFEAATEADYSFVKLSALSWDEDKALENLSEIIIDPSFTQDEISRQRRLMLSALQKSIDDPSSFADDAFKEYFYGSHPYGRPSLGKINDLKKIKRKDIISHYIKYFNPSSSWLVVTGQYSPNIQSKLELHFGRWKNRDVGKFMFPKIDSFKGIQIRLVNNSSLVQSQIHIGHIGISRKIPEYLEVKVANTILGDGFASRLMKNVRVKQGLTYSIGSDFETRKDKGLFEISTFTKNKTTGLTISEVIKTYKEFYDKGVSEGEVESAKNYLIGMFPQIVETPERFSYNLLVLRIFDVPDSYLYDFQKNIQKITVKKVNAAIRKYFNPNDLKILVYSNKNEVLSQLENIGHVEVIDSKSIY